MSGHSSETSAIARQSARVVLIDPAGRTLLFRGGDPHRPERGTWWFTPGGGIEDHETIREAARREVLEETGIVLGTLGDPVFRREITFTFEGTRYDQLEHYFVAHVDDVRLDFSGWTEIERRVVVEHRWWTPSELRSTQDEVYPEELADLIVDARRAE